MFVLKTINGREEYVNPNYDDIIETGQALKDEKQSNPVLGTISDEEMAEYNATQYQRDRKVKYDALNQLELISDDAINGTTTHKDAILAIKVEIPKPTGE